MKINKLDYKGKHYVLQDADYELDFMDFVIDTTTKEEILANKLFIESHKELCEYYGIPAYVGRDKELMALFN